MNEHNKYNSDYSVTWIMLQRYISNSCNSEEKALVEKWLLVDPERQKLINDLVAIWKLSAEQPIQWDTEASWNRFMDRYAMDQEISEDRQLSDHIITRKESYKAAKPSYFGWFAAAATILLLFTVLGVLAWTMQKQDPEAVVTLQEIHVPNGQRSSIQLSDGSKVILNAGSTLRIPSNYGNQNRTLYLDGEGYFVVDHDPENPFRVYTGETYTEVLGTEFNVNAYENPTKQIVQIYVKKGLVELGNEQVQGSRLALLNPKQLGSVSDNVFVRVTDVEDESEIIGWTQGQLVFREKLVSQIIPQLENRYNIKIVVADSSILTRRLSATFESEPLTEILNIIAVSLQINYERDENHVVLSHKDPSIE